MTISTRLKHHLDARGLPFDVVPHPYAATASECAEAAHVPGDQSCQISSYPPRGRSDARCSSQQSSG